ncbi:MAG: peptidyl-prolyl cis-trans isomerase [Thermodesulfovibrionales bacterium]|nr:peptidyl-prolyl cis-trans isomerase [Thermodesulfovibrionales bacterium]
MRVLCLVMSLCCLLFISCKKADMAGGDYVVKIDNQRITEKDLQKEFETLPDMAKQFFSGPDGAEKFADELVKKEVLYIEAVKRGYDKKEDFQKKVEEFKKLNLINQLLEEEMKKITQPTDADLKDYYEKHKNEFMISNQVRLSQIVVKDEAKAREVFERLQKGEDFAKVAKEMSVDKNSAKSGGDLGYFKRGELNKELDNIAFRLKKDEISNPIPLKDGIHFIKVTDTKGTIQEFEKVKPFISQKTFAEKQRTTFEKIIDDTKKKYKIEINKEALKKVSLVPKAPQQQQQVPDKKDKKEEGKK